MLMWGQRASTPFVFSIKSRVIHVFVPVGTCLACVILTCAFLCVIACYIALRGRFMDTNFSHVRLTIFVKSREAGLSLWTFAI